MTNIIEQTGSVSIVGLDDATNKTTARTFGLDAIQLAALRKASDVCFYHRPKPDLSGESSYISANKRHRVDASNPFGGDASVIIPCEWSLREYTRGDAKIPFGSEAWNGFEMLHCAQSHDEWITIASLLRVGDKLTLHWQRGGWTTESMENASPKFYGDSLSLHVERGDKRLAFHVAMQVCEDNTARMIRKV
jgi:hypothetical protein